MVFCWIWENNCQVEGMAAWVQAIGSIGAIIASGCIATYQARNQHTTAMNLFKTEKRHAHLEVAKTLSKLAKNCHSLVNVIAKQVGSREAIDDFFDGKVHIDVMELRSLERAMESVRLIDLPDSLVSQPLILSSGIRQFRENVEYMFENYSKLDADQFAKFLKTINEIKESLALTCKDITAEVGKVQAGMA